MIAPNLDLINGGFDRTIFFKNNQNQVVEFFVSGKFLGNVKSAYVEEILDTFDFLPPAIPVTINTTGKTIIWKMESFGKKASSMWIIQSNRIEFQIITLISEFFFCYSELAFVQGTRQLKVSQFPAPGQALIKFEDGFDGCSSLKAGVILKGFIDGFPSWFNPMQPFTMFYGNSSVSVK